MTKPPQANRAFWPDGRPVGSRSANPHDIARAIERQRQPWWICWYGDYTCQFWALNAWHATANAWFSSSDPNDLIAKMDHFEKWHPNPGREVGSR